MPTMNEVLCIGTGMLIALLFAWGFRPPTHMEWLACDRREFQAFVAVVGSLMLMSACGELIVYP